MEVELRDIDDIIPFKKNPKIHPQEQIDMLKRSIEEFGWTNPILISQDNMIIAGHGRHKAAQELGLDQVPTIFIDLPYEKAVAYVVADNRLAEIAEQDNEILAELLQEIDDGLFDAIGFCQDDIDELLADIDAANPAEIVEDEAPEAPADPVTERGDVWILGKHRLMCGDSTDTADVAKLMDGNKADMVFTDPPYGIDVVSGTVGGDKAFGSVGGAGVIKANKYSPIIGDDTTDTARKFYANCEALDMHDYVIWGGNYFTDFLPPRKGWVIWDKKEKDWDDNFSDFEMAWTNREVPAKIIRHMFMGMVQKGGREKRVHPTQKPVAMIVQCFECIDCGINVFDGFGGSGSTMMACEQTGRVNYSMELDPKYCDVIIQRYINFTGDTEIMRNGEPYTWTGPDE